MSTTSYRVFSYLTAEKAELYRAIMRAFTDAKAQFRLHLRPGDVAAALASSGWAVVPDSETIEAALSQLAEWGNVEWHPDTSDVATVEEFLRARRLFQLSEAGEAVERALGVFDESLRRKAELQTAALTDVRAELEALIALAAGQPRDDGKIHRTLKTLCTRFEELTVNAQSFLGGLQRTVDLQGLSVEEFLAYKQRLIGYLERFIGELVLTMADVAALFDKLDASGVDDLLDIAARRDLIDAVDASPSEEETARRSWGARWSGLRSWFISSSGPSQGELLRRRARTSITALLETVANLNDRRASRSDRSADLRTLARWFAEVETDADAHRLWRAAFGLAPARHLTVDDETLEQREAEPIAASTSWLEAPPLRIAPRLRATGQHGRRGRLNNVIDLRNAKAELAHWAEVEARQLEAAQRRLASGQRTRLSELGELETAEFGIFLDLLGDALASPEREAITSDGTLSVRLEPIPGAPLATIRTIEGELRGPDHFITIRPTFAGAAASDQPNGRPEGDANGASI